MKYDFGGYATKNNVKCADGRVIRPNAFAEQDGRTVPLVYQHVHTDPLNVLGHAVLENREDGVYAYCSFNDTESGKHGRELVKHGDISSLSIYANRLKQQGSDVLHGMIREVSMVLAGANPEAKIDNVSFAHADGFEYESEDDVIISMNVDIDHFAHADDKKDETDSSDQNGSSDSEETGNDKTVQEIYDNMTDEKKMLLDFLINASLSGDLDEEELDIEVEHADESDGPTVEEVWNTFTEEEKKVAEYLIGKIVEEAENDDEEEIDVEVDEEVKHFYEGDDYMYETVFNRGKNPAEIETEQENTLTHADFAEIVKQAKSGANGGSLKDTICHYIRDTFELPEDVTDAQVLKHGIEQIDILFPEAKTVGQTPELISRDMDWVTEVMNGVKKSPFSRIKTVMADITEDEARARGYITGNKKKEEVFKLLKRKTTPTTVYKLQKLDRDDVIDATEMDVVAWLRMEMRLMLNEEIARAATIGDGREESDEDKISEDNIRPIYHDDDLFTIKTFVTIPEKADRLEKSDILVDAAIESRIDYKGSGNPVMYASPRTITTMLLARDKVGHRLYKTVEELAAACRVSRIVECPVFEGATRETEDGDTRELLALIVNLKDYTIGADRGGEVNMFDDFDINYNKYEYLIETRCSGALTKPYSAIAIEVAAGSAPTPSTLEDQIAG